MANHTIDKFTYGGETYILQDNTSGYIKGISSSDVTTALGYTPYNSTNPNGYTSNIGTITGITMNGSSKGTSGVVDLGTVITAHQSIKTINNTSLVGSGNVSVQPTLVSGTNIKTINNESLLGSGNIEISSGVTDVTLDGTSVVSGSIAELTSATLTASDDGNGNVTLGLTGIGALSTASGVSF